MQNASTAQLNAGLIANLATAKIDDLARVGSGLSEGYEGKVVSFGYEPMAGLKIPFGEKQIINLGGVEYTIEGTPETEKETGLRHALVLKMEDGSNVFPTQLRRSAKTTINGASARKIEVASWNAFIGKTLKVSKVEIDKSLDRVENAGKENERVRSYKAFVVTIV